MPDLARRESVDSPRHMSQPVPDLETSPSQPGPPLDAGTGAPIITREDGKKGVVLSQGASEYVIPYGLEEKDWNRKEVLKMNNSKSKLLRIFNNHLVIVMLP